MHANYLCVALSVSIVCAHTIKLVIIQKTMFKHLINCRAGGNGTAGTAMAVPVFEGEKWRRLDSNVIECPLRALRRSLGRPRGL